jgi:2-isopropylmalate synthase
MEFSQIVQEIADRTGKEISSDVIWRAFNDEYLKLDRPYGFVDHQAMTDTHASEVRNLTATLQQDGGEVTISGRGNGPIDAFMDALRKHTGIELKVIDYREHSVGLGNDASAVAYLETRLKDGRTVHGVGMDSNIVNASLRAVVSAANRAKLGKVRELQGAAE